MKKRIAMRAAVLVFLFSLCAAFALATGYLTMIRDLISTSNPGALADHTITFSPTHDVPPSGRVVIAFQGGNFDIPSDFDYADVDFSVSTVSIDGPFFDRALATMPTATVDGITIADGLDGSFLFTLASAKGIAAGDFVRVELGKVATFGELGTHQVRNAFTPGSYRVNIRTEDPSGALIDRSNTMIAIVQPVGMGAVRHDVFPPTRSGGFPVGNVPIQADQVQMTLNTDEYAYCRYSGAPGTPYANMTGQFSRDQQGMFQSVVLTGLQSGGNYTYYIKCMDVHNNINPDDYIISFSLIVTVTTPTYGGPGELFPPAPAAPQVTISGLSYPMSEVTVLQNNVVKEKVNASIRGEFTVTLSGLSQGTHAFGFYATDKTGRKSTVRTVNVGVVSGMRSAVTDVLMAPTIALGSKVIKKKGDPLKISGAAIVGSAVEIWITPRMQNASQNDTVKIKVNPDDGGLWAVALDTSVLAADADTYIIKARSVPTEKDASQFSDLLYLGVGKEPEVDMGLRADLNKDGKVNLVDFSILLFNWGTADDVADINLSGKVDITDFSIMLYYWTG